MNLQAATIFTLARYTVPSSDNDYLYTLGLPGASGSQMALPRTSGSEPYHYDGSIVNTNSSSWSAIGANQWYVFSQVYGGTSANAQCLFRNTVPILTSTATNPYSANASTCVIGNYSSGSFHFVGDLVEFLVYDRALSDAERRQVEEYLRSRAGLPPFADDLYRDLSDWTVVQYEFNAQPDAQWVLHEANTAVDQLVNCDASILLADFDATNTVVSGRFGSGSAPDYMGFVFGYQNRGSYYLFDWKKTTESWFGIGNVGMTLRKIHVPLGADPTGFDLWQSVDTPNVTTLFDNAIPWVAGIDYDFTLSFRPGNFTIEVRNGPTLLQAWTSSDSTYTSGRFGYYVNSLQNVRFGQITLSGLPIGMGCGQNPTPPTLVASAPIFGEVWTVRLTGAAPLASGLLALSSPPPSPLNLGLCSVEIDLTNYLTLSPLTTDALGTASFTLPLPQSPTFPGLDLVVQALIAPTSGPFGFDLSNAVLMRTQ